MRPSLNIATYTPFHDLFAGNFVFVQHVDLKVYHVWMGRAKSDVLRY